MDIIDHANTPLEQWREGVMTQMRMSFMLGGRQLCIFDQFCDPGLGAPTHIHAVEEVLEVISGSADIWVDGTTAAVRPDQSVLIPAGASHGFRNTGTDTLHVRATLAASIFEAQYESTKETSRRWSPTIKSVG
ncbi:cupin domain-containing protein [Lichenihabitans sp. PAMC28606]|uniref:cupin domain-containing protein n=1 Tax=Lichenihabitans sp. PAMC28606 TaxID=2880932 RepID=UPI001D0AE8E8|nr:cupin domain-containing protein [Lichenihabitans sp. PAMC28606]UDL96219.1 cupin domain-containing protein [Lichenihabitans sp. PAMC28606]